MTATLADDTLKCNSWNENVWIQNKTYLKFIPNDSINNNPALVEILAPSKRQAIVWTIDG